MARTCQLMARDANPNAADAPEAPPAAGKDNDVNLPMEMRMMRFALSTTSTCLSTGT